MLYPPVLVLDEGRYSSSTSAGKSGAGHTLRASVARRSARGVVTRQRQVPERVQPGLVNPLPLRSQRFAPRGRQILALRHDVLNRVLIDHDPFLAAMVLHAAQPVRASVAE